MISNWKTHRSPWLYKKNSALWELVYAGVSHWVLDYTPSQSGSLPATRYVKPMLAYYKTTVCDAGSALNQHWSNISCLLDSSWVQGSLTAVVMYTTQWVLRTRHVAAPAPVPAKTRNWTNAFLMLSHRLRRWANIKTASVQCLVSAGCPG